MKNKTLFKNTGHTILLIFSCIPSLFSQETYVFFGSYNWDKTTEGIYLYRLNTSSGKMTKVTSISGVKNPSFLTLSPDGNYLFACTESKTPFSGSVSSFRFDPNTQSLQFINTQKSGGENPVYLTVHKNGKWLVNGNYTESGISVYPIADDGTLSPAVEEFRFIEGSIHPQRQAHSHIHSAVFSPDFTHIFFPDLGSDKIRSYPFKSDNQLPIKPFSGSFIKTTTGSGPRHFTFHPNGKYAYGIEELSGTITFYKYTDGNLDSQQRVSTLSKKHKGDIESSDIHISPDGKFLYASNRGLDNNIAIFSIDTDGKLKLIRHQATYGKHPRVFGLDESGKFLIVTNSVSGNAVVFKRNSKTGRLKKVNNELNMAGVSCVKIKSYD